MDGCPTAPGNMNEPFQRKTFLPLHLNDVILLAPD